MDTGRKHPHRELRIKWRALRVQQSFDKCLDYMTYSEKIESKGESPARVNVPTTSILVLALDKVRSSGEFAEGVVIAMIDTKVLSSMRSF